MARVPGPPVSTHADPFDALAVSGAPGVDAVGGLHVALGSFPTLTAVTPAAAVDTVAAAQHGTHTCKYYNVLNVMKVILF